MRKVRLELIPPFDADLVAKCLSKHAFNIDGLQWPEAVKAMYKNVEKSDNELLHIISCCNKARENFTLPFKDYLWNKLLKYPVAKEFQAKK